MSVPSHSVDFDIQLAAALSTIHYKLLFQAAEIATRQQANIFLVGGPVRDLILRRPLTDLDLVVEGDAWPIAEAFSAKTAGKLTKHAAFRTAVVTTDIDGKHFSIDFVTTRREEYPAPAALPIVIPSHIHDDMARRDFTINALALHILPQGAGDLLDPFEGTRDIAAGLVRILHDRSFFDDPTRILRAARFASRLGFVLEPATQAQISLALREKMITRTSPQRILNELWLTLDESEPESALRLLHQIGAFEQLALAWNDSWDSQFESARTIGFADVALDDVYVGLLVWPMSQQQRLEFRTRYNLPAARRKLLDELPYVVPLVLIQQDVNDFEIEQALHSYSLVALRTLQLVASPVAADHISHYLVEVRPLPALLSGDDLRTYGVAPGPQYRLILAELRQAQLMRSITTYEAAVQWLKQRVT